MEIKIEEINFKNAILMNIFEDIFMRQVGNSI